MWLPRMLVAAGLVSGLAAPGALGQKQQIILLQRDVALLQDELRRANESSAEKLAQVEAMLAESSRMQERLAEAQASIEVSLEQLSKALDEPLRATSARLDVLEEQFGRVRVVVSEIGATADRVHDDVRDIKTHLTSVQFPMTDAEGEDADQSAVNASEAIYEGGRRDYQRGEIDLARAQFLDYLSLYPNHTKADEVQFYLAETYYAAADYEEAVHQYDQVYKRHPLSPIVPDALYKQALSYEHLRRREEAIEVLGSVVSRFPNSSVAGLAHSELNRLESSKPSPAP